MEEQGQVTQSGTSVDWLPSLFQAIGSVFDTISTALEPTVLSAQAYFQQLLNAQAVLQDPLAQKILAGEIRDGETVTVSVRGGALTLNGERVETATAPKPSLRLLN